MARATRIDIHVSTVLRIAFEVKAYYTPAARRLKVALVCESFYLVLSEDCWTCPAVFNLPLGEFVVVASGTNKPIIKEVKEAQLFIDTGKRLEVTTNLWGEVWRLTPEQLALLTEKEKRDETASQHQSEHRSEGG